MALNNQEAKIHVGKKDAYITSTTSQGASGQTVTSQTVNFVDTGIQLAVTPTINRDGFVTMKIKPEISDATSTSVISENLTTSIPIVSTSEAETTVMVKDGVTIIIAGLKKDKREKSVKKVPFFGDIPGLGFFFRSTSDNATSQELIILLTPHIVTGERSYTEFSEIPPKEGVVAKMKAGRISKERYSQLKVTSTPEAESNAQINSADYFRELINKINLAAKKTAPKGKKGEVMVSFKVNYHGDLIDEPVVLSATDGLLVGLAVKAVKDAFPYQPFPKELNRTDEVFKINLLYE
jgi:Flp pilus assembly secretin CpaC